MNELAEFKYKNLTLQGLSRAGTGSCFIVPELKICLDVAQGWPFCYPMKNFLVTHGHMDHAGGLPYIVSQRSLMHLPVAPMYVPEEVIAPLTEIMTQWQKMEDFDYKFDLRPAMVGQDYDLSNEYFFRPFKTVHRVPSVGYVIYQRGKKLKTEFIGLSPHEISKIHAEGVEVDRKVQTPILAYTGDTQIEFIKLNPEVVKSKVLLMECTYFDDSRTVERARQWGHIHFKELLENLSEISSEKILLTHCSTKHRRSEVLHVLDTQLSQAERKRIFLFP